MVWTSSKGSSNRSTYKDLDGSWATKSLETALEEQSYVKPTMTPKSLQDKLDTVMESLDIEDLIIGPTN